MLFPQLSNPVSPPAKPGAYFGWLNQYATLWFSYRATAERLKHEKYLFLSGAGAYKGLLEQERLITLAERVEEHVSTEHANWFNETRNATITQKSGGVG